MQIKQTLTKIFYWKNINPLTVTTLYTLSEKSLATAIIFVIINILALYSELGVSICVWGSIVVLLSLLRLYMAHLFKTSLHLYSIEIWYMIFVVFSLLTALAASTLGFILIHYLNAYYQLYVLASLLGLTAGATISLSSDFRVAVAYISIIILPLGLSLAMHDSPLKILILPMLILFFLAQVIMIAKSYTQDKQIHTLMETNQSLLKENKHFIADMVHQIRTPLTVIMTNTSLIEMKADINIHSNVRQINSAIGMLNNAYEDLAYIISNDSIEYKAVALNFSHFMQERIDFFNSIAEDNLKHITTEIHQDINISMNDTELERLVDNNITNAIKHSNNHSEICIKLEQKKSEVILTFISKGKEIKDVSKVFDKNYTESHSAKRSLGLGLNMVKNICEKNQIHYYVDSKDSINTFSYIFKI